MCDSTERRDGLKAVHTIVRVPQQPSGLTFVASFTLPFRNYSYVLKVQCSEHGTTGMREAVLLDRHMASGSDRPFEPYAPEHDAAFPAHPLSRARRTLERASSSLRVGKNPRKQA